jgi:hypothetical protein
MIPTSLSEAEQKLRSVIERRLTGEIPECLADYGEVAGNEVKSLLFDDPIRGEICEHVAAVLEWARLMVHAQRSTVAEELRLLQRAECFLGAEPIAGPRLRLDL